MPQTTIVSFGRAVPHARIDHAGGQYVYALLTHLTRAADIHVFAPSEPGQRSGDAPDAWFDATELGAMPGDAPMHRFGRLIDLIVCRAMPIVPPPTYRLALARSRTVRNKVREADCIDVQWTDYATLLPWLRRRSRPTARIVCTMHDVLSEKWERRAKADGSVVMRARAAVVARVALRLERTALASSDQIVVFSDKDLELLVRRHGSSAAPKITVIDPPLGGPELVGARTDVDPNEVLFVGAMSRPENHDSAMWFLGEIWPLVQAGCPEAHLTIAGSRPQPELVAAARQIPTVTLTGFVDELAPLRERAAVFVAPVVAGAGVKFKVIDAMLARVPVVATSRAQEGIGTADQYVAVTDDPAAFATATLSALTDPERAAAVADATAAWAHSKYGPETFAASVASVYGIA